MAKMAEGFKAIRMAEMELGGKHDIAEMEEELAYFKWDKFTEEEFRLCPPVVAVGGDGAMYDIGFQNLSGLWLPECRFKVFVVDTQVYSNTGSQACTSGENRSSLRYGTAWKGKAR